MIGACELCGAPIVRGVTRHGIRTATALDLNASPTGRWTVANHDCHDHLVRRLGSLELAVARQDQTPLHQPHADTCRGDL